MCGRIYLPSEAEIERYWHIGRDSSNPFPARYNVSPAQGNPRLYVPVIRSGEDSKPELAMLQWWLLPWFSKEPKCHYSTFNARIETVAKSASFRDSFKRKRCLVPVLGYFEWQQSPKGMLPWLIQASDRQLMHFAGLWDRWNREDKLIESFTIIVRPANEAIKRIHDRQPVIVPPERQEAWLDRKVNDVDQVMELLKPVDGEMLKFYRVSTKVNSGRSEGSELIEPLESESVV